MRHCKGNTRTGASCRAPAGEGGLCFFHANPDRAKALGQVGGRKNRRSIVDLQLPDNATAADLRHVTVQAIRLLLSGDMHAREAGALARLCNSVYRMIPTADLEARVAMLEEQVAQEESGTSPGRDSTGSPTDGAGSVEADARMEAEPQNSDPIDAATSTWTHREDRAGSASGPPEEAEEA